MAIKISIVTPCFNAESYIEYSLQSVLSESYCDDIEHIVVDGGSSDGTVEILKKYEGRYNLKWISEPDSGIYDALNKAITLSSGEYIGWLNADDIYEVGAISKCLNAIKMSDARVFTGDGALFVTENGKDNVVTTYNHYQTQLFSSTSANIRFAHLNCCFIERGVFRDLGSFDESFMIAGDREYMLRMMEKKYEAYHLGMVVCKYRMHKGSLTFNKKNIITGGAFLEINHPVRIEVYKIALKSLRHSRDFGVVKWSAIKIFKYSILFALGRFMKD